MNPADLTSRREPLELPAPEPYKLERLLPPRDIECPGTKHKSMELHVIITILIGLGVAAGVICTGIENSLKRDNLERAEIARARAYLLENGINKHIERQKLFKTMASYLGYGLIIFLFLGVAFLGWKLAIIFLPLSALVLWKARNTLAAIRRYGWLISGEEYETHIRQLRKEFQNTRD